MMTSISKLNNVVRPTAEKQANAMLVCFLNEVCKKWRQSGDNRVMVSVHHETKSREGKSYGCPNGIMYYNRYVSLEFSWVPFNHHEYQELVNEAGKREREWKDALQKVSRFQNNQVANNQVANNQVANNQVASSKKGKFSTD